MLLAFSLRDIITVPFGYLIAWLYQITSSYGLALIIFTIIVKLVLLPISAKSKKSMMKISRIAPLVNKIREKYPDIILMADISNYAEGINAWKCGVDIVGTTMSGYTAYTSSVSDGPDYELMERLARDINIPVIGEGRIHYPDQAVKALQTGAWAIVVGGAITRPLEIAMRFQNAIKESR